MTTAREKIGIGLARDAIGKPVDLNSVDWHVRQQNPSASPSEVRDETLEVIHFLVSGGYFRLGSMSDKDERFAPWKGSLDHSMERISHVYVKHYDDPEKWMFAAWMQLTDKGDELARAREERDIASYRTSG
jgi:hypothetical protein